MTTFDRMNDLTVESTNTLVDGLFQMQAQSVALAQSVLNTVVQNQQTNRDLTHTMIQQTQEAQKLWYQLAQESARAATDAFAQASRQQVDRATETMNNVAAQAASATRRAPAASNSK